MKQIALLLFFFLLPSPGLYAQAQFYQGKTITLIVGSGAGTAYDMYGRLLANHIGKHIPGSPNVMVQNMPAAGGMVAANFVYEVAKPDGLTIASINPAHYFNQLQGNKEVKFDWTKFTWLASSDKSNICSTCAPTRRTRRFRTFVKQPNRPNAAPPAPEPAGTISPHARRGAGHKVYDRNGLRRWQRNRFGYRAKRSRVPLVHHGGVLRAGAVPYMAPKKLSFGYSYRRGTNETRGCRRRLCSVISWTNSKPPSSGDASSPSCSVPASSAARSSPIPRRRRNGRRFSAKRSLKAWLIPRFWRRPLKTSWKSPRSAAKSWRRSPSQ